jgi:hypothetical protein
MWNKLYPAVPRHWLFAIAGIIWVAVGFLLCARAIVWLDTFSPGAELLWESIGGIAALAIYHYELSNLVGKNIDRIATLPESACVFAFAAWRSYIMIGLMVLLGITLRNSPIPKFYLAIPYTAMGGALMVGSVRLFRHFIAVVEEKGNRNGNP